MSWIIKTSLLCLFVCASLKAASTEEIFAQANTAFLEGKYASAVETYESLQKTGYSAALSFNLANAYYREGKVGNAVLNYERAIWLNPHDADAKANLKFVRRNAGLFEPSLPWWKWYVQFLSLNQWAWLSSLLWFCLSLTLAAGWLFSPWRRNAKLVGGMVFALLILSLSAVTLRMFERDRAVLLAPKTALQIAPFEKSPTSFSLPAGMIVQAVRENGNFVYVRTDEGRTGWVSKKDLETIIL
jgi:tetratricopeptide (TPR) repeat protein